MCTWNQQKYFYGHNNGRIYSFRYNTVILQIFLIILLVMLV